MSVSLFNRFIQSKSSSPSSIATVDQLYGDNGYDRNDDLTVFPCTTNNVTCFYSDNSRWTRSSSSSRLKRDYDGSYNHDHGCSNMIRYYKLPLSSHNDNHRSQLWSNVISQFFNHVEKC